MKKIKGFTLIELLVVIAIISILAVIALYSYTRIRKQARDVRRREDIASVASALQLYYQDNVSYPTSGSSWTDAQTALSILTTGKYIQLPQAASGLFPYTYCTSDSTSNYVLRAKLEIPKGNSLSATNNCSDQVNYYSGDYTTNSGADGYASKSSGFE